MKALLRPSPRRARADVGVGTAVWLGVSTAVLLFAVLTLVSTWTRGREAPTPPEAVHEAPLGDVDVWVADLGPGVKEVLSSEWNQPAWDAAQDEALSKELGLDGAGLAFYSLLVFNTSDAPATVPLPEGGLVLKAPGGVRLPSRSLSAIVAAPPAAGSPQADTLRLLGAARDSVVVPPGRMARRPVAFSRRVPLAEVEGVESADGTAFHRRRIERPRWAAMLQSPTVDDLRDL